MKYPCGDLRAHVISPLSILSIGMYTTTSGYQADTTFTFRFQCTWKLFEKGGNRDVANI